MANDDGNHHSDYIVGFRQYVQFDLASTYSATAHIPVPQHLTDAAGFYVVGRKAHIYPTVLR